MHDKARCVEFQNLMPTEPHFAIIIWRKGSYTEDGGHGYGIYTSTYTSFEYYAYDEVNKEAWEQDIKRLYLMPNEKFNAFHVDKIATIYSQVHIS